VAGCGLMVTGGSWIPLDYFFSLRCPGRACSAAFRSSVYDIVHPSTVGLPCHRIRNPNGAVAFGSYLLSWPCCVFCLLSGDTRNSQHNHRLPGRNPILIYPRMTGVIFPSLLMNYFLFFFFFFEARLLLNYRMNSS
jgi:hypothetical protein